MRKTKPNILLIISDDHRWCDASRLGNPEVYTPTIDRLAGDGLVLKNYYTPTPICAPGRMALYSGMFPVRNGGYPNHSRSYGNVRSITHHFSELGYRVGLHGKGHIGPSSVYSFDYVNNVSDYLAQSDPFCLVIATNEPHAPWGDLDTEHYSPDALTLPPNLLDTPKTRDGLARYYSSVTRLDAKVEGFLKQLDDSGKAKDTIVIYTSDHGAQFPGGKWTCYEPGLRIPFIMRWPGRIQPGTTSDARIQHVDVLPTLLEIAGCDPSSIDCGIEGAPDGGTGFDGTSFLPVINGNVDSHRDYVFGVMTQNGTHNGLPYPVRSITDGRYKLIMNPCHSSTYQNVLTGPVQASQENFYWEEWLKAAASDEHAHSLVHRYLHRPAEELYDLEADPWELTNLSESAQMTVIRERLSGILQDWMCQQGDIPMETELQAGNRQKK